MLGGTLERRCRALDVGRRRRHWTTAALQTAVGTRQHPAARTRLVFERDRIAEVPGNGLLRLLALADDPHDEEERHHRRHEVGIRHLPRAAMMSMMRGGGLLDDDDRLIAGAHAAAACGAAVAALQ